jgi:hypothetical protein
VSRSPSLYGTRKETQKDRLEIRSAVTKATEKLEVRKIELALYTPDLLAKLNGLSIKLKNNNTRRAQPRCSSNLE